MVKMVNFMSCIFCHDKKRVYIKKAFVQARTSGRNNAIGVSSVELNKVLIV